MDLCQNLHEMLLSVVFPAILISVVMLVEIFENLPAVVTFFPGAFWHNLCSFSKGVACLNEYVIQDRFASFGFKLSNLFVFFFFS